MWLAVIATVLVLDSVLIIAATIVWVRLCERAVTAMVSYERERLVPAIRRASVLADELLDMLGRVRAADNAARHALARTSGHAAQVVSQVRSELWPVIGLGRGIRAAFAALRRHRSRGRDLDAEAEDRFVYEGGRRHAHN